MMCVSASLNHRLPPLQLILPFTKLVFQLTARASTCHEIADDPKQIEKIARLYRTIEMGSNPRAMIFPWLPNRAVNAKNEALKELYMMLSGIIERRKATGHRNEDAFQVLIDAGDSTKDIVGVGAWIFGSVLRDSQHHNLFQFVIGVLFAGVSHSCSHSPFRYTDFDCHCGTDNQYRQQCVLDLALPGG
jgi:hypothetical protein